MSSDKPVDSFVMAADEGQAFWFLNTLTINKVRGEDTQGRLSIVDHRVPPGFAPPPHVHEGSDEALFILEGDLDGFCGNQTWKAGPGSLLFMPRRVPHGFTVSQAGPGRIIVVVAPGAFDRFVADLGKPAPELRLPEPTPADPGFVVQIAAAHGVQILPPSES